MSLHRIYSLLTVCLIAVMTADAWADAFIIREGGPKGALSGKTIAVCHSHGRYFEQKLDRWEWQRARLLGTVEDLYTRSYTVPYLAPMLENAGAYVVMPRERDQSPRELIIDPDGTYGIRGYHETAAEKRDRPHAWSTSPRPGFGYMKAELHQGDNPFTMGAARMTRSTTDPQKAVSAEWRAEIPSAGCYAVYISYQSDETSCEKVHYTVNTAAGVEKFTVNQRKGGGTWVYLGTFPFAAGEQELPLVSVTSLSESDGTITTDAVKIGGGRGNVARRQENGNVTQGTTPKYATSGMPRYAEAARYWLQWAGMPDSVYSQTAGADDYRDDIFARPMWVNHLHNVLGVKVDMMFSLHSDAGTTETDETVGTMGIFFTDKGKRFPDGRSRKLNRALADSIVSSVTRDIRAAYNPDWTRRRMRDRSYIEIRVPEVPSMLLELLSHQNFADMSYGHDPQFKFDVSRAIYKGILRYFAAQGQAREIVQPLPVRAFAINATDQQGKFRLTWDWTPDPLEPTAMPTSYIVEERTGSEDEPFRPVGETKKPEFDIYIDPGIIHSYRITAVNGGGRSFPSAVQSACRSDNAGPMVTVVNAFTRVSGPDRFESGGMAGFGLTDPAGVPWGSELSRTGRQVEFMRSEPWIDDDAPGFGSSGSEWECREIRGNTFDLTVTHGEAIMAAGYSYTSTSAAAFCADTLQRPTAVDLILGLQRTTRVGCGARPAAHKTFPPEMQARLRSLASAGTSILVSGAHTGSDLDCESDREFAARVLGFALRGKVPGEFMAANVVNSRFFHSFCSGTFMLGRETDSEPYGLTAAPDAIIPASPGPAAVVMRYDRTLMPAAVAHSDSTHRSVTLGFPFECVGNQRGRQQLMKQILHFLNNNP